MRNRNQIRTTPQMMRYLARLMRDLKKRFPADAPVNQNPIKIDPQAYEAAYNIWQRMKTPTGYSRMPKEYGGRRYKASLGHPDYHPDKWTQNTIIMMATAIQYCYEHKEKS